MYLAVILFCTTPSADSCNSLANTSNLHVTEEACQADYQTAAQYFISRGAYFVRGGCFNVGMPV